MAGFPRVLVDKDRRANVLSCLPAVPRWKASYSYSIACSESDLKAALQETRDLACHESNKMELDLCSSPPRGRAPGIQATNPQLSARSARQRRQALILHKLPHPRTGPHSQFAVICRPLNPEPSQFNWFFSPSRPGLCVSRQLGSGAVGRMWWCRETQHRHS